MKLVREILYKEFKTLEVTKDLEKEVEAFRSIVFGSFNKFIELFENDEVVVFANLYSFEWDKEHGRTFQIETATLDKTTMNLSYHGDNEGPDMVSKLDGKPEWTSDGLIGIGVNKIGDAPRGYPHRVYRWQNYI